MRPLQLSAAVFAAALLLTAASTTTASAQTRTVPADVADGGFEVPVVPAPAPFTTVPGGQTAGPWAVGGDSVDVTSDRLWDAAEGSQSLDLNGTTSGSVSQVIPTLPLTSYVVSFELAGNPAWAPALKTGELRVDGTLVKTFSFDVTGRQFRDMGYTRQTAVFTNLLKGSVTLTFTSTSPGPGGPVVDDVKVRSCLLVLCPPAH
ncbi:DUF642 domain-containing protein [Streptomyces sp. NPDC005494]|uniref:DUF642 domain-containing protein n=1 Tax=unclassified Streptomyces TaxID=2593676 RepID=UPI0036D198CD